MMKQLSYQAQLDALLAKLQEKPRLFLHACCAPCSTYVLQYLREYFQITVFFYNPNLYPNAEYLRRKQALVDFLSAFDASIPLIEGDQNPAPFLAAAKGLETEKEGGQRCQRCIAFRLEETAKAAKAGHFDFFCTTLSISPKKDAQAINTIGQALAEKHGIAFLPSDFKKKNGFLQSVTLSKEYGVYRQNYCGCVYSLTNAAPGGTIKPEPTEKE